ncbi:MAG: DUF2294 domain-containing protein [Timaviella obliquedivisa GSE-PSE-MK23-08B]|jgi:uncharacterized protein YbcI|nr:DUF2294 domain-containing protein [Timaviella obliquedivisa GSE-PSE-MK23-08B]
MTDNTPTQGQTERTLSQRIQTFYRTHLGLQPSKVTCQLMDEKVTIVLENSVTRPEQILAEADELLAQQVRKDLDAAIRPQLQDLIQEVLNVEVLDILSDTTLETGRMGIIVILAKKPTVRESTTKAKAKSSSSSLSPAS